MMPFIYTPDDYFDCGGLGEHEITFTTFIDTDYMHGREFRSVNITRAVVTIKFKDWPPQEIDVTKLILDSAYTRELWEEDIYKAYKDGRERDFTDEVSA